MISNLRNTWKFFASSLRSDVYIFVFFYLINHSIYESWSLSFHTTPCWCLKKLFLKYFSSVNIGGWWWIQMLMCCNQPKGLHWLMTNGMTRNENKILKSPIAHHMWCGVWSFNDDLMFTLKIIDNLNWNYSQWQRFWAWNRLKFRKSPHKFADFLKNK